MSRPLLVTADDFGIGPDTSRGILDLAARGVVTSTVLLANSPFAADGVARWRKAGAALELGWHPCLTLDSPVLPPAEVPSLVDGDGKFHPLGRFLGRLLRGKFNPAEVESELRAQLGLFIDLVGHLPANVNGHHHVHIFGPVRRALARVLTEAGATPYVRRVVEPRRALRRVPGARVKRFVLSAAGRRAGADFPGNDWLLGVTDPPFVHDDRFFTRWLSAAPAGVVELTCHPGHLDGTLAGRDGSLTDGQLHRRPAELARLSSPAFREAAAAAGFHFATAAELTGLTRRNGQAA